MYSECAKTNQLFAFFNANAKLVLLNLTKYFGPDKNTFLFLISFKMFKKIRLDKDSVDNDQITNHMNRML